MRILIATSAPISVDAGAGQVAINIVEVLRNQGHEVVLWTSHPCRAWHFLKFFEKKAKMDQFLKTQQAFDIISTNHSNYCFSTSYISLQKPKHRFSTMKILNHIFYRFFLCIC